ncbi:MAG: hypothetical protein KDE31_27095, partial [Caldilineaceae bacterium]|nr:hypothetical protein [Caldilineaceae bacterium]
PMVQFNWGKAWGFKAIITQMTQRFTLFLDSGVPVRATVEIAFQQVAQQGSYPPQNPTSQSVPGRRIRTVERGDRIDLIAYQEYGQASQWKHIAEVNGLVDPLSLTPGQRLIIEPL